MEKGMNIEPACWPMGKRAPIALFVSGYKRTGKDTFAVDVATGVRSWPWVLYRRWDIDYLGNPADDFKGAEVASFAGEIKRRTWKALGWETTAFDYEKVKDYPVGNFSHRGLKIRTPRDLMISIGAEGRAVDEGIWTKLALSPYFVDMKKQARMVVVSDHRYPDEVACAREAGVTVVTIRVFRQDSPVPPMDEISEHALDDYATDYIAVSKEDHMCWASILMPQYRNYIRTRQLF